MALPARLDPQQNDWLHSDGVARIFAAVKGTGGTLRFVGGCVRDALLGRAVADIDFACDLPPEKTIAALKGAGLKFSPTGLAHGTITAIADHQSYEITTLRHDVETDGRRAKVAFTYDWQADAARRDFTMNALYADGDGTLYDYFQGRDDLAAGHVRFIGNPQDRIREDILRILRFFRFHAWYGRGAADAEGLKACCELAGLIPQLSIERVWREVNKWLAAPDPSPSWGLMREQQILPHLLPEATDVERLTRLIAAEKKFETRASSLARLTALLPKDGLATEQVARKLKMSNRETEQITALATVPQQLAGKLDLLPFRRALYQFGADICREGTLLLAANDAAIDIEGSLAAAAEWQKPVFPIVGDDMLKLGLAPGPRVGDILRALEEWWIVRDFRPTRAECLEEAQRLLTVNS